METLGGSDHGMSEGVGTDEIVYEIGDRTTTPPGGSRRLFRRLTHNAGRILLLWLILSSAISYAIYRFVEPTYQASSMIRVESRQIDLFDSSILGDSQEAKPSYLQTEIEMLRSNLVLSLALSKSGVTSLPMIKDSLDPKADLRTKLDIQVIPNTHWIRVSLESKDPREAADIVNEVVFAYQFISDDSGIEKSRARHMDVGTILTRDLAQYEKRLKLGIDETRQQLRTLAQKQDLVLAEPKIEGKVNQANDERPGDKTSDMHVYEIEASFLRDDLDRYNRMYDHVHRKLEQLHFNEETGRTHIQEIIEAEVPKVPPCHLLPSRAIRSE